jgi:beta-galactosidase
MRRIFPVVLLLCCGVCAFAQTQPERLEVGAARRVSLDRDWRFLKGDAPGAEQAAFDDSHWRRVRLPHDWAIEGPFSEKLNPHTGALPVFGTGWYRKHFTLPASEKGRYFTIVFDGAMSNAHVWFNGKELGERPYGYSSFAFDLTPYLKFGGADNVLAVRLAPEEDSSRWYPGAGIYRNVWLDVTGPVHVAEWGTYVTTPEVTESKAQVKIATEVENSTTTNKVVAVSSEVFDEQGHMVGFGTKTLPVPGNGSITSNMTVEVPQPQRWDIDRPYLYTLVTRIIGSKALGGRDLDRYTTPFGIRTVEFTPTDLKLNGRSIRLQGVCDHHDLGALGAAVNRRATERQLQILKSMGVNAIRTSHNPPSPELLEFADKLGFLVMDEAFDMWKEPKVKNGYSKYWDEWSDRDLTDMIHRDRNHPSVILWSIGNEIPEQESADGWKIARHLAEVCHREDPTRLVTSAMNSPDAAIKNNFAQQLDVKGINYNLGAYKKVLDEHPDWIVLGSETESAVSSRGVYDLPIEKYQKSPTHQLTSYDVIAPSWAYIPDAEWAAMEENPRILGEFVWTGFDYLGEPTPYFSGRGDHSQDWPARSSYFGIVDLAGFPKDRYYLYQSHWTTRPMVHVLPHWNWAGREGQPIPVMVYTNADEAELFLNGKSLGKKARYSEPVELPVGKSVSDTLKFASKYRLEWQVPYAPGILKVIAYDKDGKQVATDERVTAGPPAKIELVPDRSRIKADGDDLSFVTVKIEDKDGNLCPLADNMVQFKLSGPGTISAVDNGNAATFEAFQADYRKAFNGLALLIVRSEEGKPGAIRIDATSEEMSAYTVIRTAQMPESTAKVADEATAIRIAERALSRVYGERQIKSEEPFSADFKDGIWTVAGTLWCHDEKGQRLSEPGLCEGGVVEAKIRASDGNVLKVMHGK